MDDGVWGGKVGPNAANMTTVEFEVNTTAVTKRAQFIIRKGYSGMHVAAELAKEWNAQQPLPPEGPLAVVSGSRVSFQGTVTRMAFTLNPPGTPTEIPDEGTAIPVVDGLVVFRA